MHSEEGRNWEDSEDRDRFSPSVLNYGWSPYYSPQQQSYYEMMITQMSPIIHSYPMASPQNYYLQRNSERPVQSTVPSPVYASLKLSVASPVSFKASCEGPCHPLAVEAMRKISGARYLENDEVWELPLSEHMNFVVAMQQANLKCERIPDRVLAQLAASQTRECASEREQMATNPYMDDDGFARTTSDPAICDIPRFLWQTLAPFQRAGVSWIVRNQGRCLLADEPGLGKTIQAIAAAFVYYHEWPLLIVAPSSARFHWQQEFTQWLPDKALLPLGSIIVLTSEKMCTPTLFDTPSCVDTAKVIITSYDLVYRDNVKKTLERIAPNVIICDECHYLKNGRARRTKTLLPLLKAANRAILLTGTPALSRPIEVFWQLHALDPQQWPEYNEFLQRYCGNTTASSSSSRGASRPLIPKARKTERHLSSLSSEITKYTAASNLAELHTLLRATLMLRRNKASILTQLPAKRRIRREVSIDDIELAEQLRLDLAQFRECASELAAISSKATCRRQKYEDDEEWLPPATKKSKASHDMAPEKKALLMELFRKSGSAKLPAVARRLTQLLEVNGKLLIFAHHRAVLDGLEETISNIPHIRIDGCTPAIQRQSRVSKFQNDPDIRVALLGITAAGVALTLTAAARVLFAELYWTPAALLQAEDRAHRIGQTSEVIVEYLLAPNTVDEVLWPCVQHKMGLLGELIENQKQLSMRTETAIQLDQQQQNTSEDALLNPEILEQLHHEDPEAVNLDVTAQLTQEADAADFPLLVDEDDLIDDDNDDDIIVEEDEGDEDDDRFSSSSSSSSSSCA